MPACSPDLVDDHHHAVTLELQLFPEHVSLNRVMSHLVEKLPGRFVPVVVGPDSRIGQSSTAQSKILITVLAVCLFSALAPCDRPERLYSAQNNASAS